MRSLPLALLLVLLSAGAAAADHFFLSTMATRESVLFPMAEGLVQELFARIGHQASLEYHPPKRSLQMAAHGLVDGDVGRIAGLEAEFPDLVMVPEPLGDIRIHCYALDPSIRVNGWEDLSAYSVIQIRDARYAEPLKTLVPPDRLFAAPSLPAAFKMLLAGRADLVLSSSSDAVTTLMLPEFQGRSITKIEPPLETVSIHLYLHRTHVDIVPLLDQALREMKTDGTYDRIVERFMHFVERGE